MKVGRNDPCSCGSGKKFKKCCIDQKPARMQPKISAEEYTRIINEFKKREERDRQFKAKYGDAKPFIHAEWNGHKVVAVGNTAHLIPLSQCKTVHDFLGAFIKAELTPEWGNSEIAKPFNERHPILQWYDSVCRRQQLGTKGQDGIYEQIMSGAQAAYYNLANDLYYICHNAKLRDRVLHRLKHREQFQGARYELMAAASLIRAGYDVEFEDEDDGSSNHPEFIATHKETGSKLAVEAKSRHRPGMLGQPGEKQDEEDMKTRIGSLLNDALKKEPKMPFVIFMDVNMPPQSAGTVFEKKWARDVMNKTPQLSKKDKSQKDPFNMIVFTNHPHHFGGDHTPSPERDVLIYESQNPLHSLNNALLRAISDRVLQYGNIPKDFPEN